MGAPFRPANLVVGAASWNSAATTFDLASVKGDLIAGVLGGVFVCAAVESGPTGIVQFVGSQVYVEAGESREEWDLAFIDKRATLGEDGEVTWRG